MSFIGAFAIGFVGAFVFMFLIYFYQMHKVKDKATKDMNGIMEQFKDQNKINDEDKNKDGDKDETKDN